MDSGGVMNERVTLVSDAAMLSTDRLARREASAARPYVPPIDLLLEGLEITERSLSEPIAAVSTQFLRFLLSELARGAPFDAGWYGTQYPDVREAGSALGADWLHNHFITQGYFEGRLPQEPALDADWYFRHYADVWAAYSAKLLDTLREHFLSQGWTEGRAGTPQQADVADGWIEAARRMGPAAMVRVEPADEPESEAPEAAEAVALPAAGPVAEHLLMRDFESLGWNCEFGLVQRRFNIEPISLFAFATIPFGRLAAALGTKFGAFGQPEGMTLVLHDQEYCLVDLQNEYSKHTWIYQGAAEPADLLKRESRKVNFLKAKLVRELLTGSKIFVYKNPPGFSQEHVSELYYELLSYGDNVLLWVDVADDIHRTGDIELLFGRLYKGYVDRFSPVERAGSGISYDAWFEICAKAHRLWRKPSATGAG